MYRFDYQTPLGKLSLVREEQNLIGAWFEGQQHYFAKIDPITCLIASEDDPLFTPFITWLDDYFAQKAPDVSVLRPYLKPKGTAYQQAIWQLLLELPYGKTTSYLDIATRYGDTSARAVGGAVGKNPLSLFIPCHRVIAKNGNLTGYAGGLDRKTALLNLEKC